MSRSLKATPSLLEGATVHNRCRRWTGGLVRLQRIGREFACAMRASSQALRTIVGHVCAKTAATQSNAAFSLAVNGFLIAGASMILKVLSREANGAKFTASPSLGARVLNVIGHHDPGNLGAAPIRAKGGIVLACV